MTFAAARAELAALEPNPLATSPAQQFRFCVKDFGEILDTLEAAQKQAAEEYARRNPLGGPAVIFDAMADRVRAGEDFYAVLADYGFAPVSPSYCPRCGKPVTACCEMEEKDCE